jgi:glycosyltransferase involved in cell wall biosynthesis
MKKALFITFYWPPSGKASMHWLLKMAELFPEYNWSTTILTVQEDTVSGRDNSYEKKYCKDISVIRTKFWDPFKLYKKVVGKNNYERLEVSEVISKTNASFAQKISLWIRMNLFIPDARIGWRFSGYKEAVRKLKDEKFDLIVSSGPPHSTHLLSKKISKKLKVSMVSVFIDPWVDISYYKGHSRNFLTRAIDSYLEKSILKYSKKTIFVTKSLQEYFLKKYSFLADKTELLYWGYNEIDFQNAANKKAGDHKIILHAGNMYDHQNPINFWKNIKGLIDSGENIKLRFVGTIGPAVRKSLLELSLNLHSQFLGFLPYKDVIQEVVDADYLIVCIAEPRHIPGKLFEYMRSGNPIIAFGDNNTEVKSILTETNSGILYSYSEDGKNFFTDSSLLNTNISEVKKFSRENIVKSFIKILNENL